MSIDACWPCALSAMIQRMASASTGPLLCLAREPAVRVGGVSHALGTREAALLAWLAIEGPTSRADLASLLWPDSDAEAARSALRQRIFQLRRIAGGALVVGTQTLALAEGVTHDLDGADSVLGDRSSALGASFDAWLDRQRSARRSRLHRLLVERAERAEAAGELGEAIGHARELLARDLLSEDAHRRLIRLLYLAGERPQALLAFDRCEQLLKDEVGVSPSPETLALLQTIVRAESARRPEAPAQAEALVPAAVLRPPLRVGRAHAWDLLAAPRGEGAGRAPRRLRRARHGQVAAARRPRPCRQRHDAARRAGDGAARRRTGALRAGGAAGARRARRLPGRARRRAAHAPGAHRSRARPDRGGESGRLARRPDHRRRGAARNRGRIRPHRHRRGRPAVRRRRLGRMAAGARCRRLAARLDAGDATARAAGTGAPVDRLAAAGRGRRDGDARAFVEARGRRPARVAGAARARARCRAHRLAAAAHRRQPALRARDGEGHARRAVPGGRRRERCRVVAGGTERRSSHPAAAAPAVAAGAKRRALRRDRRPGPRRVAGRAGAGQARRRARRRLGRARGRPRAARATASSPTT